MTLCQRPRTRRSALFRRRSGKKLEEPGEPREPEWRSMPESSPSLMAQRTWSSGGPGPSCSASSAACRLDGPRLHEVGGVGASPRPARGERPGQPNGVRTAPSGPVAGGRCATTSSAYRRRLQHQGQRMPTSGTGCRARRADCRPPAAGPARAE